MKHKAFFSEVPESNSSVEVYLHNWSTAMHWLNIVSSSTGVIFGLKWPLKIYKFIGKHTYFIYPLNIYTSSRL
jgi:hypothetical protein